MEETTKSKSTNRYTQEELNNAVELLKTSTYKEVTRVTGISKPTLYAALKRCGISKKRQYSQAELDRAMRMLEVLPLADVCITTGIGRTKLVEEKARRRKAREGV